MTQKEILKDLEDIYRDVFADDEIVLTEETTADDIDEWDSLMQITLLATIQDKYGITFKLKDVKELKCVGDLVKLIDRLLNA